MDNTKLQNIAKKVIDNTKHDSNDENFGAIVTILIIISIVLTIIRILQECNKTRWLKLDRKQKLTYFGAQIKEKAISKSWLTRRIIKKTIRQELSLANYKKYGVAIMNAILVIGEALTDDEINTLAETINV